MPLMHEIAAHLDALLRTADVPDYATALNGVQVETARPIERVAAAVDARERTIRGAIDAGATLLLVHHGLFWGGVQPLVGPIRRRVAAILDAGLGVYSSHIPLDLHPELGNNALLARALGLRPTGSFGRYKGIEIGVMGDAAAATDEVVERVRAFAAARGGTVRVAHAPPARLTRRWAIVTGAGASSETLREAAERGVDTLITGEGAHHTAIEAEELDVTVIYAGHYATETLGVEALARHVGEVFGIPWTFVDAPTGL
jgi:dinuclear metal center YbgI/SA1388 family protein